MANTQVRRGQIADELTDGDFNAANVDGVAGTPSLRTLGTGSQQAAAGNHTHTSLGTVSFSGAPTFSTMTAGSVLFAGVGGLVSQDNTGLFWDDANNRLGIGTSSPSLQLHIAKASANAPSGVVGLAYAQFTAQGTATVSDRIVGLSVSGADSTAVVNKTVTGMSRSGTTVTVAATAHGFANGDVIAIYGVTHTFDQEVNGTWAVANAATDAFDITVAGLSAGSYTSGGTATNRPMYSGVRVVVAPRVARGGLTGTAANADDVCGFSVTNTSGTDSTATDAFYIGHNPGFGTGQHEWVTGFNSDANTLLGAFRFAGRLTGSDANSCAVFNAVTAVIEADGHAVLVPNNSTYAARNAADAANVTMFRLNSSDQVQFTPTVKVVTAAAGIQLILSDSATDAAQKVARVGCAHYTNSEEPMGMLVGVCSSGGNDLRLGGGTGVFNAATVINFYTAGSTTTQTGTVRLSIDAAGVINITDGGNVAVGTTTGTKIGTATTQKLGFFNATPVVQPGAATDLLTVLSDLGLRAAGTAAPLTTTGAVATGALTSGNHTLSGATSGTTTLTAAAVAAGTVLLPTASGTIVESLFTSTATATSNTKNTTVTLIGSGVGSLTLPANFLIAGKTIRGKGRGYATLTATSPATLTFIVKLGSTTICTAAAYTPATAVTNAYFEFEFEITCRTTGGSGTVFGQGRVTMQLHVTTFATTPATIGLPATAAVTVDTTASQVVDVTVAQSNATNAQTLNCTNFVLEAFGGV